MEHDMEESRLPSTTARSVVPTGAEPAGTTIFVNGARHRVSGGTVDREILAGLAFPGLPVPEERQFTIAFRGGPPQARQGLLADFHPLAVIDEESFVVVATDRS